MMLGGCVTGWAPWVSRPQGSVLNRGVKDLQVESWWRGGDAYGKQLHSRTAVGSNPGSATLQMWDVLNLYDLSFLNLVKVVLIQP